MRPMPDASPKPRNVLLIVSDEHSPRYMGCSGHPVARPPHIDALAARGVRFQRATTPSPICVPARASLATGRSYCEEVLRSIVDPEEADRRAFADQRMLEEALGGRIAVERYSRFDHTPVPEG